MSYYSLLSFGFFLILGGKPISKDITKVLKTSEETGTAIEPEEIIVLQNTGNLKCQVLLLEQLSPLGHGKETLPCLCCIIVLVKSSISYQTQDTEVSGYHWTLPMISLLTCMLLYWSTIFGNYARRLAILFTCMDMQIPFLQLKILTSF